MQTTALDFVNGKLLTDGPTPAQRILDLRKKRDLLSDELIHLDDDIFFLAEDGLSTRAIEIDRKQTERQIEDIDEEIGDLEDKLEDEN